MKNVTSPAPAKEPRAPSPAVAELASFEAMGIGVVVLGPITGDATAAQARTVFEDTERRLSRFLPESELSQLNSRARGRARVSPDLFSLLRLCRRMQAASGGVFDPGVLPSLEHLGYDREFRLIGRLRNGNGNEPPGPRSITEVKLEESKLLATVPDGVRLDLGGVMRGWAMDRAAEALAPLQDFIIDAGGDIVARGNGPAGGGWVVALGHPVEPGVEVGRIVLCDAAIATSSTAKRRWRRGDTELHDIIDPRSGLPAETDCISASVIAPSAIEADVFAKGALILGSAAGKSLLKARGYAGLFVREDGGIEVTEGWEGS